MAYRPGAGRGSAAYDQHMESENDALINGLSSKVEQLKAISIQIGGEVGCWACRGPASTHELPAVPPSPSLLTRTHSCSSEQMRNQNKELDHMNDTFDRAGGLLGGTMKRLGALASKGGDCTMCYLAAFVFAVLLLVWRLTK